MDQINRVTYGVSTLGFILVSVGIFFAYSSPATGYELSIYTHTPVVYWICLSVSILLSVLLLLSEQSNKAIGVTLGGLSISSLAFLPIIRGYYQVGATDAMSHWGTAQQILQTGEIAGWRYPAIHVSTAMWSLVSGQSANTMIYLLAAIYVLIFPIFVFILLRRLNTGVPSAEYFGFLSSMLLLPINQIGVRIEAHPTSQAVLFLPVIIFVTILYYNNLRKRSSILIVLFIFFYIHLHPQQAANLVLLLGLMSTVSVIIHKLGGEYAGQSHSYRHFPTLITGIMFWALLSDRDFFVNKLQNAAARFVQLTGRGAETVEGRASSVDAVGGSLEEIFIKLFFISTIFCGLYALNILIIGWSVENTKQKVSSYELMLTVGVLSVVGMVLVYLIGGISDQFARHLGFVMVIVTILGSLALARLYSLLKPKIGIRYTQSIFILFFVFCLVLSVPVVHSSEYIYRGSGHVPEAQVSGYDTALEYYDVDQPIIHTRSPAFRYATVTTSSNSEITKTLAEYHQNETASAPIHFNNQSIHKINQSIYVGVVESDISRDADLYNGFKFSHADFVYLETHPKINKVVANNQFQLYQSPGESSTNTSEPSNRGQVSNSRRFLRDTLASTSQ